MTMPRPCVSSAWPIVPSSFSMTALRSKPNARSRKSIAALGVLEAKRGDDHGARLRAIDVKSWTDVTRRYSVGVVPVKAPEVAVEVRLVVVAAVERERRQLLTAAQPLDRALEAQRAAPVPSAPARALTERGGQVAAAPARARRRGVPTATSRRVDQPPPAPTRARVGAGGVSITRRAIQRSNEREPRGPAAASRAGARRDRRRRSDPRARPPAPASSPIGRRNSRPAPSGVR